MAQKGIKNDISSSTINLLDSDSQSLDQEKGEENGERRLRQKVRVESGSLALKRIDSLNRLLDNQLTNRRVELFEKLSCNKRGETTNKRDRKSFTVDEREVARPSDRSEIQTKPGSASIFEAGGEQSSDDLENDDGIWVLGANGAAQSSRLESTEREANEDSMRQSKIHEGRIRIRRKSEASRCKSMGQEDSGSRGMKEVDEGENEAMTKEGEQPEITHKEQVKSERKYYDESARIMMKDLKDEEAKSSDSLEQRASHEGCMGRTIPTLEASVLSGEAIEETKRLEGDNICRINCHVVGDAMMTESCCKVSERSRDVEIETCELKARNELRSCQDLSSMAATNNSNNSSCIRHERRGDLQRFDTDKSEQEERLEGCDVDAKVTSICESDDDARASESKDIKESERTRANPSQGDNPQLSRPTKWSREVKGSRDSLEPRSSQSCTECNSLDGREVGSEKASESGLRETSAKKLTAQFLEVKPNGPIKSISSPDLTGRVVDIRDHQSPKTKRRRGNLIRRFYRLISKRVAQQSGVDQSQQQVKSSPDIRSASKEFALDSPQVDFLKPSDTEFEDHSQNSSPIIRARKFLAKVFSARGSDSTQLEVSSPDSSKFRSLKDENKQYKKRKRKQYQLGDQNFNLDFDDEHQSRSDLKQREMELRATGKHDPFILAHAFAQGNQDQ